MRSIRLAAAVALLLALSGCVWFRPAPRRHDEYAFDRIARLPYMGGSLLYNAESPELSHLVPGARVPIRLGALKRIEVPAGRIPEEQRRMIPPGEKVYEWIQDGTPRYGTIAPRMVGADAIALDVVLFDARGQERPSARVALALGRDADLDGDGDPDLEYVASLGKARGGEPSWRYLRFISSRETLSTAMFSYVPEKLPELSEAGGNLGFNVNGDAIVRIEGTAGVEGQAGPGMRSLHRGMSIEPGDVILDVATRRYRRVSEEAITPSLRASRAPLPLEAVLKDATDVLSLAEVLPVFAMRTTRADGGGGGGDFVVVDARSYESRAAPWRERLGQYALQTKLSLLSDNNVPPFGRITLKKRVAGAEVGFEKLEVGLGLDADVSISWSGVRGAVTAMAFFEGAMEANATQAVKVTANELLASYSFTQGFVVGPFLMDVTLTPAIGVDVDAPLPADGRIGAKLFAAYGVTAAAEATWTAQSASASHFGDAFMQPYLIGAGTLDTAGHFRPWIMVTSALTVGKLLQFNVPVKVSAGPAWGFRDAGLDGIGGRRIDVSSQIDVNVTVDANVDVTVGLNVGIFTLGPLRFPVFGGNVYRGGWTAWKQAYSVLAPAAETAIVNVSFPVPTCPPGTVLRETGSCDVRPPQPREGSGS